MTEKPFSERHGYSQPSEEIKFREDAPKPLRYKILSIAPKVGLHSSALRDIICDVLMTSPDSNNWSAPNVQMENQANLEQAEWYQVYDIIEAIHKYLRTNGNSRDFADQINETLIKLGAGWKLFLGEIVTRGDDTFETTVTATTQALGEKDLPTATRELKEAIADLSRRPEPDLSGSLHHALGALECVAREITGEESKTLGEIIKKHPTLIPRPLDESISKIWGFASEYARHIKEGRKVEYEEAQLIVSVVASTITYLTNKIKKT